MDHDYKVSEIDPHQGFGVTAQQAFNKGDVIFKEYPLVCAQFSWNKKYNYLACDHCLAPLEDAQENARRLADDIGITLPHMDLCIVDKSKHVSCPNCNYRYCSEECRKSAFDLYHSVLCLGAKSNDPSELLNELDEIWRESHPPPETSTIQILIKIVAMHFSAWKYDNNTAGESIKALESFVSSLKVSSLQHKLLRPEFGESINTIFKCFDAFLQKLILKSLNKNSITLEEQIGILKCTRLSSLSTREGFCSAICMLGRNEQGISTSSFSVWLTNVLQKYGNKNEEFNKFIDNLYDRFDEFSGSFLDCEGVGLYKTQRFLNHSCWPNCEIKFNGNDNCLTLVSIAPIISGDQLTISYLDSCLLRKRKEVRNKYLSENYLFECRCKRCLTNDANETFDSEESSDSESELVKEEMDCN